VTGSGARLLALALEAKQLAHGVRKAYLEGALTAGAVARAASHLGGIKARSIAIHGELSGGREATPEPLAESRRQFGFVWSSVRTVHATLALAYRHHGVTPPRPTRVDAAWRALKSKFVAGWPASALPPRLESARPPPSVPPPAPGDAIVAGALGGMQLDPASASCPVCATALSEPRIECPTCAVFHHAECWDYAGGCGVYGCRKALRGARL